MAGRRSNPCVRQKHALQLFKTDMCRFFVQGECKHGDRCVYAHNPDEIRNKPDLTRTSMCKTLLKGGVCMDRTCRFAHDKETLRATCGFYKMKMCGFAQSGRCKNGENCRFAHSTDELRPPRPSEKPVQEDMLQPWSPGSRQQQHGTKVGDFFVGAQQDAHQDDRSPQSQAPAPPRPFRAAQQLTDSQRAQASSPGSPSWQSTQFGDATDSTAYDQQGQGPSGSFTGSGGAWNESDSQNSGGTSEVPRSEHTPPDSTQSDSSHSAEQGGTSFKGKTQNRQSGQRAVLETGVRKEMTLLVTNVPAFLTQGALLSMFEDLTPEMRGKFDFFYCPWDEQHGRNLGCALFNFPDPNDAATFQRYWANKELCRRGEKTLRVMKAVNQGLASNLDYFSKAGKVLTMDPRFRPLARDSDGTLHPMQSNLWGCQASQEFPDARWQLDARYQTDVGPQRQQQQQQRQLQQLPWLADWKQVSRNMQMTPQMQHQVGHVGRTGSGGEEPQQPYQVPLQQMGTQLVPCMMVQMENGGSFMVPVDPSQSFGEQPFQVDQLAAAAASANSPQGGIAQAAAFHMQQMATNGWDNGEVYSD